MVITCKYTSVTSTNITSVSQKQHHHSKSQNCHRWLSVFVCLFLLVIVLSVLRFSAADYLFGIFKLFLLFSYFLRRKHEYVKEQNEHFMKSLKNEIHKLSSNPHVGSKIYREFYNIIFYIAKEGCHINIVFRIYIIKSALHTLQTSALYYRQNTCLRNLTSKEWLF